VSSCRHDRVALGDTVVGFDYEDFKMLLIAGSVETVKPVYRTPYVCLECGEKGVLREADKGTATWKVDALDPGVAKRTA